MKRSIGDVRPSQIVTTFGPGAIVDLQTLSVIVAGLDGWPVDEADVIHEPRLERALRVARFFSAHASEGGFSRRQGTVPTYVFPRYQVCPNERCQTLSCLGDGYVEYDPKWGEMCCTAPGCPGRGPFRATTVPAPFIVACPAGHIDDFPWREYVHRGEPGCRQRMTLYSVARTGSVADIHVRCACGRDRPASDAFGELKADALGSCTRKMPWLGNGYQDSAACPYAGNVRAMQRGATNAWFSVVRTALAVKEAATPLGIALKGCNPKQIEKIDSPDKLQALLEMEMFPQLAPFSAEEVWQAIRRTRGEVETDEVGLRWPEWAALRDPNSATSEQSEFVLEEVPVPVGLDGLVSRVVLARKLLEVRALVGFTRVDTAAGASDDNAQTTVARIYRDERSRPDWLPAVEVRGEGIFLELRESAVASWETSPAVAARAAVMAEKFAQWEAERSSSRDAPPNPFPGARFVLLHTLAHALIRQLSLDCGYSASSVRERIYSSTDPQRRMSGILLYTASADSEGSLGGLVELGRPDRLPDLLRGALRSAAQCSSDPLCADHQPDLHATINAAACHACVLASETSCETFNRFLDRNVLVPTMARSDLAFFRG